MSETERREGRSQAEREQSQRLPGYLDAGARCMNRCYLHVCYFSKIAHNSLAGFLFQGNTPRDLLSRMKHSLSPFMPGLLPAI